MLIGNLTSTWNGSNYLRRIGWDRYILRRARRDWTLRGCGDYDPASAGMAQAGSRKGSTRAIRMFIGMCITCRPMPPIQAGRYWKWLIGADIGAVTGAASQFVSDVVSVANERRVQQLAELRGSDRRRRRLIGAVFGGHGKHDPSGSGRQCRGKCHDTVCNMASGQQDDFNFGSLAISTGMGAVGGLLGGKINAGVNNLFGGGLNSCSTNIFASMGGKLLGGLATDSAMQGIAILSGQQEGWNWNQTISSGITSLGMTLLSRSCFSGDTKLMARGSWGCGFRRIHQITLDDEVLSRPEDSPKGSAQWKKVEELFNRTGRLASLHVGGQVIRTTLEHPFYEYAKGWVPAGDLKPGDLLSTEDGQWVTVEEVYDAGEWETVYNLRVADYHTYFVGGEDWGFSVWRIMPTIRS